MQDTVCLSDGLVTSGPLPLGLYGEQLQNQSVLKMRLTRDRTDRTGNSFVQTCMRMQNYRQLNSHRRRFKQNQNFVGGDNKVMKTFQVNKSSFFGGWKHIVDVAWNIGTFETDEVVLELSTGIVHVTWN